jgi:hypothetical protein
MFRWLSQWRKDGCSLLITQSYYNVFANNLYKYFVNLRIYTFTDIFPI